MSSRIAGGSGSFGAAGWVADAASAAFDPPASPPTGPLMAGGTALVVVEAGISGFTAAFVILGTGFSRLPSAGSVDLALAFVAALASSPEEATAGSAFGSALLAGSFFAAGVVLSPCGASPAGVDGTIDAILSFSTSTYP